MNKSERVAYAWLLGQGIATNDILFQKRRCPDFFLSDGRRYEVKDLKDGHTIFFGSRQWQQIMEEPNTLLLLVQGHEVVDVLAIAMLDGQKSFGHYRLVIKPTNQNGMES